MQDEEPRNDLSVSEQGCEGSAVLRTRQTEARQSKEVGARDGSSEVRGQKVFCDLARSTARKLFARTKMSGVCLSGCDKSQVLDSEGEKHEVLKLLIFCRVDVRNLLLLLSSAPGLLASCRGLSLRNRWRSLCGVRDRSGTKQ